MTTVGRPFQKGKSGNPGGRPKCNEVLIAIARTHTREALEVVLEVLRSKTTRAARLNAAKILLGYAWGRSTLYNIDVPKSWEEELALSAAQIVHKKLVDHIKDKEKNNGA